MNIHVRSIKFLFLFSIAGVARVNFVEPTLPDYQISCSLLEFASRSYGVFLVLFFFLGFEFRDCDIGVVPLV